MGRGRVGGVWKAYTYTYGVSLGLGGGGPAHGSLVNEEQYLVKFVHLTRLRRVRPLKRRNMVSNVWIRKEVGVGAQVGGAPNATRPRGRVREQPT